jgi:hypothetical protein
MPWDPEESRRHTKKASSAVSQRQWSSVANSVLAKTGDEGKAVRIANGVVKKRSKKSGRKSGAKRG